MANLIQIKRSLTTATAPSLANGELAFTANGDHLFIGSNGASITIAGKFNPGVLTANQALVANGTGYLDAVKADALTVRTITANGVTSPGAGYLLSVDAGGNTYWLPQGAVSINTAAQFSWTNTHTFSAAILANTVNATSFTTGATGLGTGGVVANVTTVFIGNNTVNSVFTSGGLTIGGTSTIANTSGVFTTGTVNAASHTAGATGAGTGGTVANTTTFFVGNNTVNALVTSAGLVVNGTATVNSTGFWSAAGTANVAVVSVGTNFIANSTQVTAAVPAVLNANVTLGDATADKVTINGQINTSVVPDANVTYSLGSTSNRWNYVYGNNVTATTGSFAGNLTVTGDLNVTGNLVTQNVSSVIISDPIIYLAGNNYTSDAIDIGFAANYSPDGIQELHTGLIRKAGETNYRLFYGSTQELSGNNLVNTAAIGYTTAGLIAYLAPYGTGGAFIVNSTAVSVTANATVAVNITANSLTLGTPLAVTSGGIGRASITAGAILVGNGSGATTVLAAATDGYVLQSNGTSVVYGTLDGGTF